MWIGSVAIKDFGRLVFGPYVAPAPFLPEQLLDYFLGGIDDNAVWSSFMWSRMLDWAINGPPSPPLPPFMRPRPSAPGYLAFLRHLDTALSPAVIDMLVTVTRDPLSGAISLSLNEDNWNSTNVAPLANAVFDFVYEQRKDSVHPRFFSKARAAINAKLDSLDIHTTPEQQQSLDLQQASQTAIDGDSTPAIDPVAFFGTNATQYFGAALCSGDVNHDGVVDVIMGSPSSGSLNDPQRGAVSIFYSSKAAEAQGGDGQATIQDGAAVNLFINGFDSYGRFGSACVVLDVNLDGYNDLVVSAPSVGGKNLVAVTGNYTGKVYVFLGTYSAYSKTVAVSVVPNITINGTLDFGTFGSVLFARDVNQDGHTDLIAASPFASNEDTVDIRYGAVFVFFASSSSPSWRNHAMLNDMNGDLVIIGPEPFSWFGMSVEVWVPADTPSSSVLLIGAPGFRLALIPSIHV